MHTPYGVLSQQTPTYYLDSFQTPPTFQMPTYYCMSVPQMHHPLRMYAFIFPDGHKVMQDNDLKCTSRHAKLFIEQKGIERLQKVISEVIELNGEATAY